MGYWKLTAVTEEWAVYLPGMSVWWGLSSIGAKMDIFSDNSYRCCLLLSMPWGNTTPSFYSLFLEEVFLSTKCSASSLSPCEQFSQWSFSWKFDSTLGKSKISIPMSLLNVLKTFTCGKPHKPKNHEQCSTSDTNLKLLMSPFHYKQHNLLHAVANNALTPEEDI